MSYVEKKVEKDRQKLASENDANNAASNKAILFKNGKWETSDGARFNTLLKAQEWIQSLDFRV
jgi:hypothetical protein